VCSQKNLGLCACGDPNTEIVEQYIHNLIATDPEFVPQSVQIEKFFELLTSEHQYRIISDKPFQRGLRVTKPSGKFRSVNDPMTREHLSIEIIDHIKLDKITNVSLSISDLSNYAVSASGEWASESQPLVLLTTDEVAFDGVQLCDVGCHVRPEPVSTSCWDMCGSPNVRNVPEFGTACEMNSAIGIFSHPWTGALLEVPNAGCCRFWIEFEFGKFLLPKMTEGLDLFPPLMVSKIEDCFRTRFGQGWRFN